MEAQCKEMEAFVIRIRTNTGMQYAAPKVRGLPPGSQPLLHWKNHMFALHRREFDPQSLHNDADPPRVAPAIPRYPGLHQEAAPRWAALIAKARATDDDLIVPAKERARYEAAFSRFASVFPDRFLWSERGRYFPDDSQDRGRALSAGYHNVMGFVRDDTALQELILDEAGKKELDRLWLEFDFVAAHTERTWLQYFLNQSGEVDGKGAEAGTLRPANHKITDSEIILQIRDKYLAKAAADPANDPIAPEAIRFHYDDINATLRNLERLHLESEPKHLQSLLSLAARAYRRPLTKAEGEELTAYYQSLRGKKDMSHEAAVRETIVAILMSPDFLYRLDLQGTDNLKVKPTSGRPYVSRPLGAYALASRLSYFLWSSMPDEELLARAAAGDLTKPDVLLAQARRMLRSPKVLGLATEFTGNWLGFRHFEKSNSVDRERFPSFTNELREAMFQEPVRLVEDAVLNNRPVLDLLYANHTFVNPVLAKHYGAGDGKGDANQWRKLEDADKFGRGGLLPMAVFLTQNSPGLRTSPVKRGNWIVTKVLGEVIPPPPPSVPELPHDEAASERPVRQMLAMHRENAACSACHSKIDSFGLAFEGYGPVGNARKVDLAGRPVDTVVDYPGGFKGDGLNGLRTYIREHREREFVASLSRKLLAYALNRSLQLADEAVVEKMQTRAAPEQYRFQSLVETILTSPQFLNKRVSVVQ
jgi:hypothetical protein